MKWGEQLPGEDWDARHGSLGPVSWWVWAFYAALNVLTLAVIFLAVVWVVAR